MAENIKKVMIYVKAKEGQDVTTLKNAIIEQSNAALNDRLFFLADTDEIVTHGHVFGVSEETKKHLENIDEAIVKIAGVDGIVAGATYEIVDDVTKSTIAAYVAKKMTTVSAGDAVAVTATDVDGHKDYAVDVVVDGKTVIKKDGKLASGVKLLYTSAADNAGDKGHGDGHPYLALTDVDGTVIAGTEFDVNDFVVDGMIQDVVYDEATGTIKFVWNADGESKETSIDLKQLFNIEGIHTSTSDYLSVDQETPSAHDDKKMAYHIDAKVDATNLTLATSISHTDADIDKKIEEAYSHIVRTGMASDNFDAIVASLADAKKVADKFSATDQMIVDIANRTIAREKDLVSDIDDAITELKEALAQEVTDRTDGDAALQTAIDEINSESEDLTSHPTSVAAKIAALRDSLVANLEAKDGNALVTVDLAQEKGLIKDLAVDVKVDTLMSTVQLDGAAEGSITIGNKTYYIRNINDIAAKDPSLVTTHDAWIYGKALMTTVKSDNNNYIKVDNVDGALQVIYEPWGEVHSTDELNNLV